MRVRVFVAALALGLGGCVSGRLPEPQVTVPPRFESTQAGVAGAIDRWWLSFDDPQLTDLIERALEAAPDARSGLARLREAQAIRRGALTQFDPQGNPTLSASRGDTNVRGAPAAQAGLLGAGRTTAAGADFVVSWEIDLLGRRAAARRTANADLAAARFDYEATRLALAADVASQLFDARGLAAQILEAQETLRIAQELSRVGRLRVTSGLGSASDAARLDTQLFNARSDLTNLRGQSDVRRRTLLTLLGHGTDPLDSLPVAATLPVPPRPPAFTPAEVMAQRPDVREAEQRLRAAAGNLRLDQLALFPRLTLQPGVSATRVFEPIGYTSTAWSLAAGLFAPVLDRRRLLSEIGAQTARGEQSLIAYEQAVRAAYADAENGLTRLSADLERLDDLTSAEARAAYAFNAQRIGYKAGVVDLDSLLQTEQAWRAARIALVAHRTATLIDAVTSFKALGGGWRADQNGGTR